LSPRVGKRKLREMHTVLRVVFSRREGESRWARERSKHSIVQAKEVGNHTKDGMVVGFGRYDRWARIRARGTMRKPGGVQ